MNKIKEFFFYKTAYIRNTFWSVWPPGKLPITALNCCFFHGLPPNKLDVPSAHCHCLCVLSFMLVVYHVQLWTVHCPDLSSASVVDSVDAAEFLDAADLINDAEFLTVPLCHPSIVLSSLGQSIVKAPQLSPAYCCVLPHTHAADFRYCHVSCHPVATIQQCFSLAYSLMDLNPVTNLPRQKEVDVLVEPSLKHLCPSMHHFSQFKWRGRNWSFPRLTILRRMGKQKGSTQRNWLEILDSAQFCYNLHRSSAIEASPFELVLGAQPQTPMEISV